MYGPPPGHKAGVRKEGSRHRVKDGDSCVSQDKPVAIMRGETPNPRPWAVAVGSVLGRSPERKKPELKSVTQSATPRFFTLSTPLKLSSGRIVVLVKVADLSIPSNKPPCLFALEASLARPPSSVLSLYAR